MSTRSTDLNLSSATPISSGTLKDKVSRKRPDLFSFNLTNPGVLSIGLKSLGRSANLSLIQDRNQNGVVDAGEVIQSLATSPRKNSRLDLADLATGTYYLQITGKTSYRLKLAADAGSSTGNLGANPGGNPGQQPKGTSSFVQQVVDLTNQFRTSKGLAPLTLNSKLTAAAQNHSQDMAISDFFDHKGTDGSSAGDRASKAGYDWREMAENIAAGQKTPAEVVKAWINSPGHRENILNANVKEIGVGYFFLANDTGTHNYNIYWTQKLGKA
jgi:uncharacterized protein YkwD